MEKIFIVDDDRAIAELMSDALEDEGYETQICMNGQQAFEQIGQQKDFSLIILDTMMPGMDGLELCRRVRDEINCPILFVTAKNRTFDMMLGLEMGADDYIAKPFVVEELVARVKAHLRREKRAAGGNPPRTYRIGEIELEEETFEVTVKGKQIELPPREFQLLAYLMKNAGQVLTKEQIFNAVWGIDYGDIGTVAVNIKNLRAKLDPDSHYIKTVWGVGYKFVRPSESLP